jgi:predicted LPLAT superfamily acyltransferase
VHFERLDEGQSASREERVRRMQEQYVACLERYCHSAPCNWFNFYDFWG